MIIFSPLWPWSYIALTGTLLVMVFLLTRGLADWFRKQPVWLLFGGNKNTRIAVAILSILTAVGFGMASLNPRWMDKPGTSGFHLQIAFDVSDSVLRAKGGWEYIKKGLYERIEKSVTATPGLLANQCTAGVLMFRQYTNEAVKKENFKDLPQSIKQLEQHMFASGEGTNIEVGLNRANSLLNKSGKQGAILLISDGNQTSGDATAVAQQLARQGVPVHVYPITSLGPAIAITDADLPRQTHAGRETFVRGMMLNRLTTERNAQLVLKKDSNEIDLENKQKGIPTQSVLESIQQVTLPSGQWVRFRWPVVFSTFGLQFVDLTLTAEGSKVPHYRRFYTYVKRPPRIIAIGGDNRWISAIPGDMAEIIPVEPQSLITPDSLKDIDAVVISGIPSYQLSASSLPVLAEAVKTKGMGLMLFNGDHHGEDAETETVILSYETTPLEPVLPVYGGPRPFEEEPRGRQIAILIDTSGSMSTSMWSGKVIRRIDKAKEIATYIVSELLRPQDRLDLITFTTGAGHLVQNQLMDEEGKQFALKQIERISPTGGTNPSRALSLIAKREAEECGLIFISDGEFGYIGYRPDCRTTVFEIGGSSLSRNRTIQQLADPIPVDSGFDPHAITIPFFEPQERLKFFEEGEFKPLSMEHYLPPNQRLPVPQLEISGSAVSHLKEHAILNGVRPKLTDPVLVYGEYGAGFAGFFASKIPEQWLNIKEGQKAIQAWISRLIPFMERDRYDFKLEDRGDEIELTIALVVKAGRIPSVSQLTAGILFPGQESVGIAMRADDLAPGTFHGIIKVKRTDQIRHALLSLRESGHDALLRAQLIPIAIPPSGNLNPPSHTESYTFGQNRELLKKIAEAGGGMFDPPTGTPFFREKSTPGQGHPLWQYFVLLAVFFYLGAIGLKRWSA